MSERLDIFRRDHDDLRRAIVREPRGHDAIVGALLCQPVDRTSAAGVIFFNNVGYLGMFGHGTIGLVKTPEHLARIATGTTRNETPARPARSGAGTDATANTPPRGWEAVRGPWAVSIQPAPL